MIVRIDIVSISNSDIKVATYIEIVNDSSIVIHYNPLENYMSELLLRAVRCKKEFFREMFKKIIKMLPEKGLEDYTFTIDFPDEWCIHELLGEIILHKKRDVYESSCLHWF